VDLLPTSIVYVYIYSLPSGTRIIPNDEFGRHERTQPRRNLKFCCSQYSLVGVVTDLRTGNCEIGGRLSAGAETFLFSTS
jgi:hypothetical protein